MSWTLHNSKYVELSQFGIISGKVEYLTYRSLRYEYREVLEWRQALSSKLSAESTELLYSVASQRERKSMVQKHFLNSFFYPESVAIVGASRNQNSFNFNLVANLVDLGFTGRIYPVNPNAEEILGLKVFPSLGSIEESIDLAVIAVSASKTFDIIRQCAAKGVKAVVIVAGGFSEGGEVGRKMQDEMRSLLGEKGIRAIGPNALSPINTQNNLLIDFAPFKKLSKGKVSFVFQSGLYDNRLDWLLSDFHLYLSKLIDLGNKMDINETDALDYLAQDQETEVIAMHLESIAGDTRKFMRLLTEISRKKPLIVLKSGRTDIGVKAASSHTGAIIKSSDVIFNVALKQSGAIRVRDLDEFFDLAKVFEFLPAMRKKRVAIATFPGGEGVIAADCCHDNGLSLSELTPNTRSKLRTIFPPWEISANPFDIGLCSEFHSMSDVFTVLLTSLADDPSVDGLAVQGSNFSPAYSDHLAKLLLRVIEKGKPVVTWVPNMSIANVELIRTLQSNRIPVYPSLERAIRALSALYRYHIRASSSI